MAILGGFGHILELTRFDPKMIAMPEGRQQITSNHAIVVSIGA